MLRSLGEKGLVIDTSVFVEYLIKNSPYLRTIEEIFKSERFSRRLFTIPLVLSETFYIVSRLYEYAGISDANEKAVEYIEWIESKFRVMDVKGMAVRAGELKKRLRISLTDCYVIAAAQEIRGFALFLKPEREMEKYIDDLRKMGVLFLSEIHLP